MAGCINLKERFGDRYRITYDPAYDHKGVHHKDPSYMQIPCEKGVIYPYGKVTLAVEINYHNPTANKIAAIHGVSCSQDGDYERTFLFHVDLFDRIAELVHPKKKRVLTDEQRQQLAERGREALGKYRESNVGSNEIESESTEDDEDELGDS